MTLLFLILIILSVLFIIIYIRLSTGLNSIREKNEIQPVIQDVSVIICLHNEEKNIPGLLNALRDQEYPQTCWELILVDDRSADQTRQLLIEFTKQFEKVPVHFIRINETPPGYAPKKYALERAIRRAKGPILLFTDADGRPGPLWIRSMVTRYKRDTGMILGYAPYSTNEPYRNLIYRLLALEYMSHATIAAATAGLGYPITCVGTNLSYRKSVYLELEGFGRFKSYHSGDDDLFLQRTREETEWHIGYNPATESYVANAPPSSWRQFYHQRLRYASKGFFYPRRLTFVLLCYFLFSLLFMVVPFYPGLYSYNIYIYIGALLVKFIFEFRLLFRFASITNQRNLLAVFPLAALLHIPYVVIFGLLGPFVSFNWAGRKK